MNKKNYIQPQLEIMPLSTVNTLCGSGDAQEGLVVQPNGDNPWENGRAPRRVF